MKYSLQHAYIKSHFNKLMYNNRYIGPSEKKSWRNMIQSAASGEDALPTCASGDGSVDDAQPCCESEEVQVEDPDTLKKTRSGKIYFTHTTPVKSILKASPPFHHGQEILLRQSPPDLAAHKKRSQTFSRPHHRRTKENSNHESR